MYLSIFVLTVGIILSAAQAFGQRNGGAGGGWILSAASTALVMLGKALFWDMQAR